MSQNHRRFSVQALAGSADPPSLASHPRELRRGRPADPPTADLPTADLPTADYGAAGSASGSVTARCAPLSPCATGPTRPL